MSERSEREKLIDKVRKVLELEERAGTPGEAAAAAKVAAALMHKHNIARLELKAPEQFSTLELFKNDCRTAVRWKVHLLHHLAEHNFCKSAFCAATGGRPAKLYLFGEPTAAEACSFLYRHLVVEINRLAARHLRRLQVVTADKRLHGTSFRLGIVHEISTRLVRQKPETRESPATTALVHQEQAALIRYAYDRFPETWEEKRRGKLVCKESYEAGQQAGAKLKVDNHKEMES